MRRVPSTRELQECLPFPQRGGARVGAGRKPRSERPGVPHRSRACFSPRHPLLVTVRLHAGLPSLRRRPELRVLLHVLRSGLGRFGLRVVHFCAQSNHLHLLVEVESAAALERGMKSLLVRLVRRLNGLWERRGPVIADRFHARELRTPFEVRNALRYVLTNHRHHGTGEPGPDPWSSGAWFDGWTVDVRWLAQRSGACPVSPPTTWLLTTGWLRHGRIRFDEVPASSSPPRGSKSSTTSADPRSRAGNRAVEREDIPPVGTRAT